MTAGFCTPQPLAARRYVGTRHTCKPRVVRCELSADTARRRTLAWVQTVVVGLRLCPFAESVVASDGVRIMISEATSESEMTDDVCSEMTRLISSAEQDLATTLVVTPKFARDDFELFHDACTRLDEAVRNTEAFEDEIVLAWFHPYFRWATVQSDDEMNFDKRAPLPIINVLRARQVTHAVNEGKTQSILEDNAVMLRKVGIDKLREVYRELEEI